MHTGAANHDTRRGFTRYGAELRVVLREEHGRTESEGFTLDVSRGGVLLRTDVFVVLGQRFLIRFLDGNGPINEGPISCPACGHQLARLRIPEQAVWARARRVAEGARSVLVAFEFESLIEIIEETGDEASCGSRRNPAVRDRVASATKRRAVSSTGR